MEYRICERCNSCEPPETVGACRSCGRADAFTWEYIPEVEEVVGGIVAAAYLAVEGGWEDMGPA